jgi:hypothetical protein
MGSRGPFVYTNRVLRVFQLCIYLVVYYWIDEVKGGTCNRIRMENSPVIIRVGASSITLRGTQLNYCVTNQMSCQLFLKTHNEKDSNNTDKFVLKQNEDSQTIFSCVKTEEGDDKECQDIQILLNMPIHPEHGGPLTSFLKCSELGSTSYFLIGEGPAVSVAIDESFVNALHDIQYVLLGYIGHIQHIQPQSSVSGYPLDEAERYVLKVKGAGFKGMCTTRTCVEDSSKDFCVWSDPQTHISVRTLPVYISSAEAHCPLPQWKHAAAQVFFTFEKDGIPFKTLYMKDNIPFNLTEEWYAISPNYGDSKGGNLLYIQGYGFDIRMSVRHRFHYKIIFSLGKYSIEVYALPLSSTLLVLAAPKWRYINVHADVHVLKRSGKRWNRIVCTAKNGVKYIYTGVCRNTMEYVALAFTLSVPHQYVPYIRKIVLQTTETPAVQLSCVSIEHLSNTTANESIGISACPLPLESFFAGQWENFSGHIRFVAEGSSKAYSLTNIRRLEICTKPQIEYCFRNFVLGIDEQNQTIEVLLNKTLLRMVIKHSQKTYMKFFYLLMKGNNNNIHPQALFMPGNKSSFNITLDKPRAVKTLKSPNITSIFLLNGSRTDAITFAETEENIKCILEKLTSWKKVTGDHYLESIKSHNAITTGSLYMSYIVRVLPRYSNLIYMNATCGKSCNYSIAVQKHAFEYSHLNDFLCHSCPQTYSSGWKFGLGLKQEKNIRHNSRSFLYPNEVVKWGSNFWNQLKVPYYFNDTDLFQISAGRSHACGIRKDNILSCWGIDADGSIYDKRGIPLTSSQLKFTRISSGAFHTCGITTEGQIRCWGNNINDISRPPFSKSAILQEVYRQKWPSWTTESGLFTAIDAGASHSCAVEASLGKVICWGNNEDSQLGPHPDEFSSGLFLERSSSYFGQVNGPFSDVKVGLRFSCGLLETGFVKCWGRNLDGESCPPHIRSSRLDTGLWHACLLSMNQTAQCWGRNYAGQTNVPRLAQFIEISCGEAHTCAVSASNQLISVSSGDILAEKGQLVCWGKHLSTMRTVKQSYFENQFMPNAESLFISSSCEMENIKYNHHDSAHNRQQNCTCQKSEGVQKRSEHNCSMYNKNCSTSEENLCNSNIKTLWHISFYEFIWLFVSVFFFSLWFIILVGLENRWEYLKFRQRRMELAVHEIANKHEVELAKI